MICLFPYQLTPRYRLLRLIGAGSFGTVYLAWDRDRGAHVAVKVLNPDHARDARFVRRFEREARYAGSILHPNVVPVLDLDVVDGVPFLVMEWIDGPNLKQFLAQHGPFSPSDTVTFGSQILAGLAAGHGREIIHRDVKPQNVLVGPDRTLKLTDFGIAKRVLDTSLTTTGKVIGTPEYMAPERLTGGTITPASDLYSAGIMLFEVATGSLPFRGPEHHALLYQHVHTEPPLPSNLNPAISSGLEGVILRSLAKDPAQRFQSAREMAAALIASVPAETTAIQRLTQDDEHKTLVAPLHRNPAGQSTLQQTIRSPIHTPTVPLPQRVQPATVEAPQARLLPWAGWSTAAAVLLALVGLGAFLAHEHPRQRAPIVAQSGPVLPSPTARPMPSATIAVPTATAPATTPSPTVAPSLTSIPRATPPPPTATATPAPAPSPTSLPPSTATVIPAATATPQPTPPPASVPAPTTQPVQVAAIVSSPAALTATPLPPTPVPTIPPTPAVIRTSVAGIASVSRARRSATHAHQQHPPRPPHPAGVHAAPRRSPPHTEATSSTRQVVVHGARDVTLRNVVVPHLRIVLTGSGNLWIWGRVNDLSVQLRGSGGVHALGLDTLDAAVSLRGSGTVAVQVHRQLSAALTGSGVISYTGGPWLHQFHVWGSGAIRSR